MTLQQLDRGTEITKQLTRLRENLQMWERANGFWNVTLSTGKGVNDGLQLSTWDMTTYVGFETVKNITVNKLRTEISLLEAEFSRI